MFESSCTACHGQNAKGGRGPDLTGKLSHGSLESEMVDNIVGGIAGTQMPAFPMPPENARAIVAYLRSLRSWRTGFAAGWQRPPPGSSCSSERQVAAAATCIADKAAVWAPT